MIKGLDLIARQQPEFINDFPTGNIYIGVTKEELAELEKELKALEIIRRNRYEAIQCLAYEVYEDYIVWYNNFSRTKPMINKEEYTLLKEVLK